MRRYMERVQDVILRYPDRPALVAGEDQVTYGQVWEESGRIYSFLKEKGIGREMFVQIVTPRDPHFLSCMLGVWRAGAAFVLVEDSYPEERIAYIRKDTDSVFVLDRKAFDEIMLAYSAREGYEKTGLHDAAYAVYTSGSTGNPKGVLHEFGNVDESAFGTPDREEYNVRPILLQSSFAFVASITRVISMTLRASTGYIVPVDLIRDFPRFTKLVEELKVTSIFLPPSYIRLYTNPSPYLIYVNTSGEPANGLYYPGGKPHLVNSYAVSEAGFRVLTFTLDHAYDVAPVGKPLPGVEVKLMDDDGHLIEGPGRGELWIRNRYVRGYINLPEETRRAFRDGMFRTGDLFRRDEGGVYYLEGRADDMIKINGNRIEPAEIEAAVQRCTGLTTVMAKGFLESGRAYVAAYFLRDEAKALSILKDGRLEIDTRKLEETLPRYMIPTYYVPLDEFPHNANGKLSRKDLKAPDTRAFMNGYEAPVTREEQILCRMMATVLGLERVGRSDDFFLIGGDSMRCIRLVDLCRDSIDIDSETVYSYRTPEQIALHLADHETEEEKAAQNTEALRMSWPLLPAQRINVTYQWADPSSNCLLIYAFFRMQEGIDAGRLCRAVNRALAAHPALHTRISPAGRGHDMGDIRQRYDESLFTPIEITDLTEEAFAKTLASFSDAIPLFDHRLYRCGIFRTDKNVYFRITVHHIITDGGSMGILLRDIFRLYRQEDAVLRPDLYYLNIRRLTEAGNSPGYLEARQFFDERFDRWRKDGIPLGLKTKRESTACHPALVARENFMPKKEGYDSVFYMTACLLAEAWYNEAPAAFIYYADSGRENRDREDAFGCVIIPGMVCLEDKKDAKAQDLISSVRSQMVFGNLHPEYCYLTEKMGDGVLSMVRFVYQDSSISKTGSGSLAAQALPTAPPERMPGIMSVNITDVKSADHVGISILYSRDHYEKENIERYLALIQQAVSFLSS